MTKKEQKQNRRKKKLFLAILMILGTGVLLGTSTYAWFTANKAVSVENIDVKVAASNGLQISVDGIDWKASVDKGDILDAKDTYSAAINQIPSGYSVPVSTIGTMNSNNGTMLMYRGDVDTNSAGSYILTSTASIETNGESGEFVAFDLFFKVSSAQKLYLMSGSEVLLTNTTTGIENAARMAAIVLGNTSSSSTTSAIQSLNDSSSYYKVIWEPNADSHTAEAITYADNTYGITGLNQSGNAALSYYGVKASIAKDANVPLATTSDSNYYTTYSNYFGTVSSNKYITTTATTGVSDYTEFVSLNAGVTKVRFYLWIEGQDVDCENDASGGAVQYTMNFAIKDE